MPHAIKDLESRFEQAQRLSPEDQVFFLQELEHTQPELAARIAALLQVDKQSDDLFARDPAELASSGAVNLSTLANAPEQIGHYKILKKIGEGGCGVVYLAQQQQPVRRRVALKIIKAGMDTSSVIARFEAERQALAIMDHPNIAKVFDGGCTEYGRPYFVMELVEGEKITDYSTHQNLSIGERLDLFLQICDAVQHAHQKGIIHRDLKPSNILVSSSQSLSQTSSKTLSKPSSPPFSSVQDSAFYTPHSALPKVIDFGIAKAVQGKLTDETILTALHQFIGTPAYMSPEQADLSPDIDTRTDIYSLGVLLYELLTGRPPFDNHELLTAGLDEMRRIIRAVEPKRPSAVALSTCRSSLPTDLDCIVLRCLEKERFRRYDTADALAADLRRFLENEPILARPPSSAYRFRKIRFSK